MSTPAHQADSLARASAERMWVGLPAASRPSTSRASAVNAKLGEWSRSGAQRPEGSTGACAAVQDRGASQRCRGHPADEAGASRSPRRASDVSAVALRRSSRVSGHPLPSPADRGRQRVDYSGATATRHGPDGTMWGEGDGPSTWEEVMSENAVVAAFKDRPAMSDVHPRARWPNSLRAPAPDEGAREVAIAYATANFTVYRALIDRLRDGERLRMETQFGSYEFSRASFHRSFPGIAASVSYRFGPPTAPNTCYYVIGPPPAAAEQFRVGA
jgi:hypothetical protein